MQAQKTRSEEVKDLAKQLKNINTQLDRVLSLLDVLQKEVEEALNSRGDVVTVEVARTKNSNNVTILTEEV